MFPEVAKIALVAARLEQFQQLLETRVILGTGHYLCRGWEKIGEAKVILN